MTDSVAASAVRHSAVPADIRSLPGAGCVVDADEIVNRIPDGTRLALVADYYGGSALEIVRRLVARPISGLQLLGVPTMGLQADLLIGAGCVASVEAAAVSLGEQGPAPRFSAAVRDGRVAIKDATCPAIHAGLQAAEKGIPFMPIRGIIGSDIERTREDWKVVDNPFAEDDPILVVPAIAPDIALLHAPLADTAGNVWIGVRRELMAMAHAARETFVTVEKIIDEDLMADPKHAAGTIPGIYVSALAEIPNGAWPTGLYGDYGRDEGHYALYAELARTEEGFVRYLAEYLGVSAAG